MPKEGKTAVGRVRGLGSAHKGAGDWIAVRINSMMLIFFYIWLTATLLLLPDLSYDRVRHWLHSPMNSILMTLNILTTFWHIKYGLKEVADDYVHSKAGQFACILLIDAFVFGAGACAIWAIIKIALQTP